MKGIVIYLPASKDSQKYVPFLRRALKKSHVKSYREVPVKKTTDKAKNYLFLIKKNIEPEKLFSSSVFTKHFIFDPVTDQASIDSDGMDIASETLKKEKVSVSTTPDPILAFGKLSVEVTSGDDLTNALNKAAEDFDVETPETQHQLS